jgi:hypothetical protein
MRKALKLAGLATAAVIAALTFNTVAATKASADSCWNHNGSVMRLVASGNQRWFYYETPRQGMVNEGVTPGTLLFNGWKNGNSYSGTARVFSRHCVGAPLEYQVQGPVRADQLQVTVYGTRPKMSYCQPTGQYATDTLVFTYMYQC